MNGKHIISTEQEGAGFYVAQFKNPQLAIFSYYVESDGLSILIDPTVDNSVFEELIAKRKSKLSFVLMSHYHADYISGHTQFKVPLIMGPRARQNNEKLEIIEYKDGQTLKLGSIEIQVIHTPGHTLESSCYLLIDNKHSPQCLFSGDTVFLKQVGRPDLSAPSDKDCDNLAEMLFDSIAKLKKLDPRIRLYPGHGSGSSCGKKIGAGDYCTLDVQHKENYGFLFKEKAEFVKAVEENLPKPPNYFFNSVKVNRQGPNRYSEILKIANKPLSDHDFAPIYFNKIPIIDTRQTIGEEGLIKGSYWLSEKGFICTWITYMLNPENEYLLVCDEGKSEEILERFIRIGYSNCKGYNGFKVAAWKGEFTKAINLTCQLVQKEQKVTHLDVRTKPEYVDGIIENSIKIPLPELEKRVEELRHVKDIVINCRLGLRARLGFSILAKHGIESKIFAETFDAISKGGVKVIKYTE